MAYIGLGEWGGHLLWPGIFQRLGERPAAIVDAAGVEHLGEGVVPLIYDLEADTSPFEQVRAQLDEQGLALSGVCFSSELFLGLWTDLIVDAGRNADWANGYRAIANKFELRQRLFEVGLSQHRPVLIAPDGTPEPSAGLSFPCVVKPCVGGASVLVKKCRSKEDLVRFAAAVDWERDFFPRMSPRDPEPTLFAEPYIEGVEFTADGYVLNERIELGSVHEYYESLEDEVFLKGINVSPPRFWEGDFPSQLKAYLMDVFRLLGLAEEGLTFHAELKYNQITQRFEVIEINPRSPGAYLHDSLEHQTGVDIYTIQARLSVASRPVEREEEFPSLRWNGTYAGSLHMYHSNSGVLKAAHGYDEVKALPGVQRLVPRYAVGDKIPAHAGEVYAAFVVVTGNSREDVVDTMQQARARLRFEIV